jgi:formylglycine-generating enzyme required for sulfatase activity/predicted Ser/Thr protein kinase
MGNRELTKGTTLQNGKYTIERVIGEGGFGITYYTRHNALGHCFAVKEFFIGGYSMRGTLRKTVVIQGIDADVYQKYLQKFIEEAQTLARLDHPNIVRVIDIFEENNTAYIVMPFVEGQTLQQIVDKGGRLDYETAVNYIAQVAEAVAYIHERDILHRDIKPENIIVTPENRAMLIDFGSAREFMQDKMQNHSTILTPGYAPLEQYSTVSRKGSYSDIYSLGATFYFALTSQMPMEATARAANEQMPEPRFLVPSIPVEANRTIMKAMELKPENRHQSIDEFMNDLLNKKQTSPLRTKKTDVQSDNGAKTVSSGRGKKKSIGLIFFGIVAVIVLSLFLPQIIGSLGNLLVEIRYLFDRQSMIDIPMVYVSGGTFTMGCTSEQGSRCFNNEEPVHQVTLSDYYIGKYEVTQAQWKAVMGSNPSAHKGDNLPVEQVSWNDTQDFIRKLNAKTGKNYRLPTEAEWEFAARGGNNSRGYKYSGSNQAETVAWYYENAGDYRKNNSDWSYDEAVKNRTHLVGTKQANELGIYDMSGNVWEWCNDWYGGYSSGSQTNPQGASSGSYRVYRGGSWLDFAWFVRVLCRPHGLPGDRRDYGGFRLASSSK